jgi:hypothetical protein
MLWAAIATVWLLWAVIVMPYAGIAQLTDHPDTARNAMASLNWGSKKRRRTAPVRRAARPAPKIATETEKARLRIEVRHAIERADQDAFDLAWAKLLDLARTKVGGDDLGELDGIRVADKDMLKSYLDVMQSCTGHPERLGEAQEAARQYNLLADEANRRMDMLARLGDREFTKAKRLSHLEVTSKGLDLTGP